MTSFRVETMAVNGPANVLVCGHTDGRISLRAVWNLQQTHIVTHSSHVAIKCLWFTEGESCSCLPRPSPLVYPVIAIIDTCEAA